MISTIIVVNAYLSRIHINNCRYHENSSCSSWWHLLVFVVKAKSSKCSWFWIDNLLFEVVRSHSHSHRFCCILCCCRCSCTLVYKTCNNDSWNLCRLCLPFTVHIGSHNIVWGNTIERIAVSTQAKQHTTKSWLNNLANSIRSSRQRIHTCWPSSFNDGLP